MQLFSKDKTPRKLLADVVGKGVSLWYPTVKDSINSMRLAMYTSEHVLEGTVVPAMQAVVSIQEQWSSSMLEVIRGEQSYTDMARDIVLNAKMRGTGNSDACVTEPVDHAERVICCGKSCRDCDLPEQMTKTILESIHAAEVDAMGVICPSCFDSFDTGQIRIARKYDLGFTIPPVYYFQLLALAQGLAPAEVGLDKHKLKPEHLLEVMAQG